MALQSAENTLTGAVSATVDALKLDARDKAAGKLALKYAEAIDLIGPTALGDFGPKLLATLDALNATPKSRQSKGGASPNVESRLNLIRESRTG